MEKLIELLNEAHRSGAELFGYCIGNFEWKYYAKNNWLLTIETLGYTDEDYEFHHFSNRDVCGKDCGFIKWLVENDKINGKKFYEKNILKGFITITKEEKADSIIMNLSISNTPIDDLISYLK